MGFPRADAAAALAAAGGDIAVAAEALADASVGPQPKRKRNRVSLATADASALLRRSASSASSPAASPMQAAGGAGRRAPAYRRPPQGTDERIERALSQRLYLLERRGEGDADGEGTGDAEATFVVMGSTGNVYEVAVSAAPRCNCPDFLRRQSPCKHVLFVWLRVLRLAPDDPRVWQKRLRPEDVREVLRRGGPGPAGGTACAVCAPGHVRKRYAEMTGTAGPSEPEALSQPGRARKALEEDDCPICYEAVEEQEERRGLVTFCGACGSNLHKDCIERWQRASKKGDCPLCREPFRQPRSHVAPGAELPAPGSAPAPALPRRGSGSGCYLNVLGDGSDG